MGWEEIQSGFDFATLASRRHRTAKVATRLRVPGNELVARDGIEPPTLRFSVVCSTN